MQDWNELGPIWLIGCGNMAGAMLERWLDVGAPREIFTVVRPSGTVPFPGVRTLTTIPTGTPRILLLGVKPQALATVASEVTAAAGPDTLLVSILAGVELATLRDQFPNAGAIVRVMPNLPVAIGRGVVTMYGDPEPHRAALDRLTESLGLVEWLDDEALLTVTTALTGSGPAFVHRFITALAEVGATLGLPTDQALRLAIAMVDGAAGQARLCPETPDALAERVASPGGTTRAGLDVLDADQALRDLILRTLTAAERRARELAGGRR